MGLEMNEIYIRSAFHLITFAILSYLAYLTFIFKPSSSKSPIKNDLNKIKNELEDLRSIVREFKAEVKEFKIETRENFSDIRRTQSSLHFQMTNICIAKMFRQSSSSKDLKKI